MAEFVDVVNPTPEEIRRWAYSSSPEPVEDFDTIVGQPEMLSTLIELVGESACPKRQFLLGSLYCLVGHSPHADERISDAARTASASADPWLRTWALRTTRILDEPGTFTRDDWCDEDGFRMSPVEAI